MSKSRLQLTLRSELSPMVQVGVNARDRKWVRGYQNQNWENTRIPTMASMLLCPVRDCSEIVMLRPPGNIESIGCSGNTENKGCSGNIENKGCRGNTENKGCSRNTENKGCSGNYNMQTHCSNKFTLRFLYFILSFYHYRCNYKSSLRQHLHKNSVIGWWLSV